MREGLDRVARIIEPDTKIPPERELKNPAVIKVDKNTWVKTERKKVSTQKKKRDFIKKFKLRTNDGT